MSFEYQLGALCFLGAVGLLFGQLIYENYFAK